MQVDAAKRACTDLHVGAIMIQTQQQPCEEPSNQLRPQYVAPPLRILSPLVLRCPELFVSHFFGICCFIGSLLRVFLCFRCSAASIMNSRSQSSPVPSFFASPLVDSASQDDFSFMNSSQPKQASFMIARNTPFMPSPTEIDDSVSLQSGCSYNSNFGMQ
jgi:hypothetical protein